MEFGRSSTPSRRDHYNEQRGSFSSRPNTGASQAEPYAATLQTPVVTESSRHDNAFSPKSTNSPGGSDHGPSEAVAEGTHVLAFDDMPAAISRKQSARHRRNVSYKAQDDVDESFELRGIAVPSPTGDSHGVTEPGSTRHGSSAEERYSGQERNGDAYYPERHEAAYGTSSAQKHTFQPPTSEEPSKWLSKLYTISYLIFFAIFGTLARLGTQWLTFYPGTPVVTPVIWANFAGSLMMGFLTEDQELFQKKSLRSSGHSTYPDEQLPKPEGQEVRVEDKTAHLKRKKTVPLYVGLSTGFCGSFTSFSSFARDYFLAISNDLPMPIDHPTTNASSDIISSTVSRNSGYSFEAWLHIVITTLALSLGGLLAGAQLAILLSRWTPCIHGRLVGKIVDPMIAVLAWGCWLGAVLMCILPPDRGSGATEKWRGDVLFAAGFAPVGCLLRWYLSAKLNSLVPSFPLGTFTVNMLGTAILGMCWDIQHVGVGVMGRVGGGLVGCQVLQGVMDGFCGCLTTVSTWVAEINGLKIRQAWIYAFSTVTGGLCLLLVIMGSVRWSVGWQPPVCNTSYTSKVNG